MRPVFKKPLARIILNQSFGEDRACITTEGRVIPRTEATCPVGSKSLYTSMGMKAHNGLDLGLAYGRGENVYAIIEGVVTFIETERERGIGIDIVSVEKYTFADHVGGIEGVGGEHHIKHRYWHLLEPLVKVGDFVKAGQVIGRADNTGLSSGDHLHLEVKPVEKNMNNQWYNVFQENMYYGAVDPFIYFEPNSLSTSEAEDLLAKFRALAYDLSIRVKAFLSR